MFRTAILYRLLGTLDIEILACICFSTFDPICLDIENAITRSYKVSSIK